MLVKLVGLKKKKNKKKHSTKCPLAHINFATARLVGAIELHEIQLRPIKCTVCRRKLFIASYHSLSPPFPSIQNEGAKGIGEQEIISGLTHAPLFRKLPRVHAGPNTHRTDADRPIVGYIKSMTKMCRPVPDPTAPNQSHRSKLFPWPISQRITVTFRSASKKKN